MVVTKWDNEILINSLKLLINREVDYIHQKKVAESFFTLDKMISKILR
jgi:hypothetical protein